MSDAIDRLVGIMARLRDPEGGCPWDLEQDLASLRPYVIEEAYEVAEAMDAGDADEHREELGDLLFQIIFQARLAEEAGQFAFDDVATAVADKMVTRHPHVFGDLDVADADEVARNWEALKAKEKRDRGALDGVPDALPGLLKALRVGEKAAAVGFDWQDRGGVEDKIREELEELSAAVAAGDRAAVEHEMGDLLLAVTSLARHVGVDAETSLQGAVRRFRGRFEQMEAMASHHERGLRALSPDELEALWERAKAQE